MRVSTAAVGLGGRCLEAERRGKGALCPPMAAAGGPGPEGRALQPRGSHRLCDASWGGRCGGEPSTSGFQNNHGGDVGEAGLGALEGDAPSDLSVLGSESAFIKGCPSRDPRLVAPGRTWLRSGKVRQCPWCPGMAHVLGSRSGEPWEAHRPPSGSSALGQGRGPYLPRHPCPSLCPPQLPR